MALVRHKMVLALVQLKIEKIEEIEKIEKIVKIEKIEKIKKIEKIETAYEYRLREGATMMM